jgi:heme-degrading monooxygenase HmoA
MMTILTHVTLKEGCEPEWDAAMRERLAAATDRVGWVSGQLLIPLEGLNQRMIIGTWQTRADWEAWHNDATFLETRRRLEGLEAGASRHAWHEVLVDGRATAVRV